MPRGRPRKNPIPSTEISESVNKSANKSVNDTKESKLPEGYEFLTQAKYDALSVCDRCHKKIISGERNINLTYLTGMAPWHRMVSLEKVCLCGDCAKELNMLVDNWLINEGKGVKKKYS